MKKLITYCLLFLFSLAFSYETLTCFSKQFGNDGFQTAVNDCEAESDSESDDEAEKKESKEDLYLYEKLHLAFLSHQDASLITDFVFSSYDYSRTVYSPPEVAIL